MNKPISYHEWLAEVQSKGKDFCQLIYNNAYRVIYTLKES